MFFAQTKEVRMQYLAIQKRTMAAVRSTVMGYPNRGFPRGRPFGRGGHPRGMPRMGYGMPPNTFITQMPGVTNFPTGP